VQLAHIHALHPGLQLWVLSLPFLNCVGGLRTCSTRQSRPGHEAMVPKSLFETGWSSAVDISILVLFETLHQRCLTFLKVQFLAEVASSLTAAAALVTASTTAETIRKTDREIPAFARTHSQLVKIIAPDPKLREPAAAVPCWTVGLVRTKAPEQTMTRWDWPPPAMPTALGPPSTP
ncbi:hypothetical protein B0J13DRAFT_655179, partial [Dactylonectria estremocensis]